MHVAAQATADYVSLSMSDAVVHQLTPGYNFNGRYFVSRCIGVGGMGSVYAATHAETHGKVALKVMLPRLVNREDMRRRFLQEAQVSAKIQSEHIVRVFDAGVDETTGMPFIVMELLEGEDLDVLLSRAGPLEPGTVIALLRQTALALDKTHEAGVVHRDLKPHNLFVAKRDDGTPCVKILDFGIAKLIDSTGGGGQTRSAGTPLYMPPEQVRGDGDIGAPADAYALAHIAYTMLVGRPFWQTEAVELGLGPFIERIFGGPTERPTTRAARTGVQLPPGFDDWFARAAAASKDQRILPASQSIAALAAVFGLSNTETISIRLPPAPTRPSVAPPVAPMPPAETAMHTSAGSADSAGATPALPFAQPTLAQTRPPLTATVGTTSAVVSEGTSVGTRSPATPVWALVGAMVLMSLAVGAYVTYQVVREPHASIARQGDDDENASKTLGKKKRKRKKKKRKPACPFERCKHVKIDMKAPVEVQKWMGKATRLAREVESAAELVMISIGEMKKGKLTRNATFVMVFLFRYPAPKGAPSKFEAIQVILGDDMLMARRTTDMRMPAVSPPRCGSQQALKVAVAAGLNGKQTVNMVYQTTPTASAPYWLISQVGESRYVHGMSCEKFAPYETP